MSITVAGSVARRFGTKRFRRDQSGTTAIEFGIVALPFFALMFAILETGMVFFAGQTLETAVSNSARLIRTGQAQQQGFDADAFKASVCDQVATLFDCADGLKLDVRRYPTFDSFNLGPPLDENGNLITDFTYQPGTGSDIVVVRAFYEWPIYARLMGLDMSNMPNGTHLLSSISAFRNEPFPW